MADAVEALESSDWTRPTDCADWDVRQLVAHVAGMAKFVSSPREMAPTDARGQGGADAGQALVDAQTAVQVEQRTHLAPAELQAGTTRCRTACGQGPPPHPRLRTPSAGCRTAGGQRRPRDMEPGLSR